MRFGESLALAEDTLVVGAPGDSGSAVEVAGLPSAQALEAGAAYVFVREGGVWTQQARLVPLEGRAGDRFGSSVAVAGDTVVVGAPGAEAGPAVDAGVAHVFVRSAAGQWSQQGALRASNARAQNEFGSSLALHGEAVLVGAPREDSGASGVNPGSTSATAVDSGAAYLFVRSGASWTQQAYVKSPHTAEGMMFGAKVALAGDLMAVSAPQEASAATGIGRDPRIGEAVGSGAVFVYRRAGGNWMTPIYVKASNSEAGDSFGQSLALSPTTLVVGAGGEDSSGVGINDARTDSDRTESGAAYVFRLLPSGLWWEAAYVKAPNSEKGDRFGISAAVLGDTVVLGADGEDGSAQITGGNLADNAAPSSGAVFVY
jgi:hypothetical protein